jgi:replicative DNA helicase
MPDRMPPFSEEAERGALGAALVDGARVTSAALGLGVGPEAFYAPAHRTVWAAIVDLASTRGMVDTLLVGEWLKARGKLDEAGGQAALDRLVDGCPTPSYAEYYLDIVRQKWICRMAIEHAREVEHAAYQAESGDALVQDAVSRFSGVVTAQAGKKLTTAERLARLLQRWRDAHDKKRPAIGLETPWESMTELLCGLEPGMTILAARPSQGKTTMEDQISEFVARKGIPVGRITLDSSTDELLARASARNAGVSLPKLKFGWAGEQNLARVQDAQSVIAGLPIYFDDESRDIRAVCSKLRAWKIQHDIGFATVDFVQLVQAGELWSGTSDNSKVAYVSAMLKGVFLGLGIPGLVLSQLSRSPKEKGLVTKRRPTLEDLRDSGALEQDAHKVVMLYQDWEWCEQAEKDRPGTLKHKRAQWADVLKHKDGEIGRIPMWLYPHYFRFEEAGDNFTGGLNFDREGEATEGNLKPETGNSGGTKKPTPVDEITNPDPELDLLGAQDA